MKELYTAYWQDVFKFVYRLTGYQRQIVSSRMAVFYRDETGNWDGTDTWGGLIKNSELQGTAYAADGTVLYRLALEHTPNEQESFLWVPVE